MAARISFSDAVSERCRSARTLDRASGTAIWVSTNMIVNATINSINVSPRWLRRRTAPSLYVDGHLRRSRRDHIALRVPNTQIGHAHRRRAWGHGLEHRGDQQARARDTRAAGQAVQTDHRQSRVVLNVLGE